ncbi:hypothetical protein MASR1M74_09780 [Lentimicrobium sp.]
MMNRYFSVFKSFADFKGRAGRSEFWMFYYINFLLFSIAVLLDDIIGFRVNSYLCLVVLFALLILTPSLAVAVRRLHDIGKSGRYLFLGLIPVVGIVWLLVLLSRPGQIAENTYGDIHQLESTTVSPGEQIIFIYIVLAFASQFFYSVLPKLNHDLWLAEYELINNSLILLLGVIPMALSFSIVNNPMKIIARVIGIFLFLLSLKGFMGHVISS